jgi:hypothetical protein
MLSEVGFLWCQGGRDFIETHEATQSGWRLAFPTIGKLERAVVSQLEFQESQMHPRTTMTEFEEFVSGEKCLSTLSDSGRHEMKSRGWPS